MGFRITKFLAAVLLVVAGLWVSWTEYRTGPSASWSKIISALPLLLVGLCLFLKEVRPFDLFRYAVGAVVGTLVVQLTGGAILSMLAAWETTGLTTSGMVTSVAMTVGSLLILAVYYFALWAKSNVRRVMENIFSISELLGKLVFTLALLSIYRIGFHVPLPGLNQDAIRQMAESLKTGLFGQAMSYFSMFTGGSLSKSTLLDWASCRTYRPRLFSPCWSTSFRRSRNSRRKARPGKRKSRNIPATRR